MEYILSGAEADRYSTTTEGANSARTIVIVLETTSAAAARGRLKSTCAAVRRQIEAIAADTTPGPTGDALFTRVALVTYDGAVKVWAARRGAKPVALALPAAHCMPTLPPPALASTWHNLTETVGALGELLGVIGEEIAEPVTDARAPPAAALASAVHVALSLIGADGDGNGGGGAMLLFSASGATSGEGARTRKLPPPPHFPPRGGPPISEREMSARSREIDEYEAKLERLTRPECATMDALAAAASHAQIGIHLVLAPSDAGTLSLTYRAHLLTCSTA